MSRQTLTYTRPALARATDPSSWRRALLGAWVRRHDPRLRAQLLLSALFVAAVIAFAHIAEDYLTGDPIVRWDVEFSRWLHVHSSPALVSLFKVVTLAGSVPVLAAVTVAVSAYFVRRGRLNEAALLCVLALGIEILFSVLKLAFHRARPELAYVHLDTYSFPSGHAAGSTAIYGALAYFFARNAMRRTRLLTAAAYAALVMVIAFSRLYLEVHYLSDVLAGISLGVAWASACLFAYEWRNDVAARFIPRRLRTALVGPRAEY